MQVGEHHPAERCALNNELFFVENRSAFSQTRWALPLSLSKAPRGHQRQRPPTNLMLTTHRMRCLALQSILFLTRPPCLFPPHLWLLWIKHARKKLKRLRPEQSPLVKILDMPSFSNSSRLVSNFIPLTLILVRWVRRVRKLR